MVRLPDNEIPRLQALRDLAVLDTASEASFDDLTHAAALACEAPIALISLVDAERQWFKAHVGVGVEQTPRALAFCAHAILEPQELFEVPDATCDERFCANPLVTGDPGIRFYAGAPLVDAAGNALGTLCVLDRRPRTLQPWQRELLARLASTVVRLFEARGALVRLAATDMVATSAEPLRGVVGQVATAAVLVLADGRIEANAEALALTGYADEELRDLDAWFARVHPEDAAEARARYEADRAAGFPAVRSATIRCRDGSRRQVEFSAGRSAGGELWLLRGATAASGAEERFRVLFEQSSDAHLLLDEHGVIDCNRAAVAMLGLADRRDLLGLHPARLSPELQPDGQRSDAKSVVMDQVARRDGRHRFEWLHRRADGAGIPVEVTLTPVELGGRTVLLAVWHDLTERVRAEEAARQRDRRWLLALEASGDGVWDWDLDEGRVFYSPRWKALLGHADDAIGDAPDEWERRVHPDDLAAARAELARHLAGAVAQYVGEHRMRCRDGGWKWILSRGMVIERNADGRPRRMIGTATDLTERRRLAERLDLEAERFRAMADAAPLGIFLTDVQGQATYLNERWLALAGLERGAALARGWLQALHPDDRATCLGLWREGLAAGGIFTHDHRFLHAGGRVVWVRVTASPMQIGGQTVGYVGLVADITASTLDHQRLVDSLARFDLVAGGAAMGIWETRLDPRCWRDQFTPDRPVYWSPRLLDLLGYSADEFPARLGSWSEATHPDDRARVQAAVMACLEGGAPYNVEYRLRHRSGEYRWFHVTGAVERDAQGNPLRFAGSLSDITVIRQAAEDMRRARDLAEGTARAKAEFLAIMSHEIRTPLNGVIGMTALLLDTELDPKQREFAGTVRACGDGLLALIDGILDFSKLEAGRLVLERIPFEPGQVVEEAVAVLAGQAQAKGLELVMVVAAGVPQRLLGDPMRLRQVLFNLLGNAIKFTAHGEVVVTLEPAPRDGGDVALVLRVRDTGVGIPAEARERLFKAFSQADSSTTRKYGGTGLGLVICQRLVDLMGGEITFTSAPGAGSEFTCTLRFAAPAAPPSAAFPALDLAGRSALVIAGRPSGQRALREQLLALGMRSTEVASAAAIASALEAGAPDVVVVDLEVPGGGVALGGFLKRHPRLGAVPRLLVAPPAQRGLTASIAAVGFAGTIAKPLRQAQVRERLRAALGLGAGARAAAGAAPVPPPAPERPALRVLIVEDEPVNRRVAVALLTKLGCRCDTATNGAEALAATAGTAYQAVFMDCQMPVMDGLAATAAIRRREGAGPRLRIIALTASAMAGDAERCLAAGMDEFLSKPIREHELAAALARSGLAREVAAPAPASAPAPGDLLDEATLRALHDAAGPDSCAAVVLLMHRESETQLAQLRQAGERGDAAALARLAHRLKGATGTLGMVQVQACCWDLERTARAGDLPRAKALIEDVAAALARTLPVLARHPLAVAASG